jgi:hypothetical protein
VFTARYELGLQIRHTVPSYKGLDEVFGDGKHEVGTDTEERLISC